MNSKSAPGSRCTSPRIGWFSLLLLSASALVIPACAANPANAGFHAQGTDGHKKEVSSSAAAAAAASTSDVAASLGAPSVSVTCPDNLPAGTRCLAGKDVAGAFYLIAVPAGWNRNLVLHAHGGPTLGAPKGSRVAADLERWSLVLRAGYAWAGSSYHQGGVAVHSAAADTERLRHIFERDVGKPALTILHGQSWGASVAAVAASNYTRDAQGKRPYDAVLLTSGVLAGGSRAYDFRLDLRMIYQALCHNHPRADEPQYPLWMGLPKGATLTPSGLHARVDECLALDKPPAARSAAQQSRIDTIVRTVKIPERSIQGHLNWATWHFQDIVQNRTQGRDPFGNQGAIYAGSADDAALNLQVARYRADPAAVALFAADTDPDGRIPVPVLTVHAVDDPVAFVEMDDSFQHTMRNAGTAGHLVQTFTSDHSHSYLTDAAYLTLLDALAGWARGGPMPTPAGIAASCLGMPFPTATPIPTAYEGNHRNRANEARAVGAAGCHFLPNYQPKALDTRVTHRDRP